MNETWLPVPGYEGLYEVSNCGQVRSCDRSVAMRTKYGTTTTRRVRSKLLVAGTDADGYVWLRLFKAGLGRAFRVSRLVLTAFERSPAAGDEACHRDHNKANNVLANLEWGTRAENEAQKTASGRRPRSTVNRLTLDDARAIRRRRAAGDDAKTVAAQYGVHLSNVYLITQGRTWQE